MPQDFILRWLLLFRQQELIQRTVHGREFPHLRVADQVATVHGGIQRFQAAQVAVIAHKITQEARGHLRPLDATASGEARHCRIQASGGKLAVFLDQLLHPVTLFA